MFLSKYSQRSPSIFPTNAWLHFIVLSTLVSGVANTPAHAMTPEEIYLKKKEKALGKTYGDNAFVDQLSQDQVEIRKLMTDLTAKNKSPQEI